MSKIEIRHYIDVDPDVNSGDRADLTQELVWPNGHYTERLVASGTLEAVEAAQRLLEM